MSDVIRILGAVAAGLSALSGALLAAPGDFVSQEVVQGFLIANLVVGAMVTYLARDGLVAYRRED